MKRNINPAFVHCVPLVKTGHFTCRKVQENKNLSISETKAAYGSSHAFNYTMWAEAGGSL